jgi:hypothetical protein
MVSLLLRVVLISAPQFPTGNCRYHYNDLFEEKKLNLIFFNFFNLKKTIFSVFFFAFIGVFFQKITDFIPIPNS